MSRAILVAEDSPTQAERTRLLLEGQGYRVEVARNGREALEQVRRAPPDLIISDVTMPEMDGYAFCRAVKGLEDTKRIPFVLLTDRRTPLDIVTGLEVGADNFIPKPFEPDYLVERVRRIFEGLDLRRGGQLGLEVTIRVGHREIEISADKQQIIELVFATFEELARLNTRLAESQQLVEEYARTLEDKVQERTAALRSLFEGVPVGLFRADPAGRILDVNSAAVQILGYPDRESVRTRTLADLVVHPEVLGRLQRPVEPAGVIRGEDVELRRVDGSATWVRLSVRWLRDAGSQLRSCEGAFEDIAARKQLEDQMRQVQKMEAVGQLAGGIAHDFNNILTIITGRTELALQRLRPGDPLRREIAVIQQTAQRAAALTRQLLAFSRKQVLEPRVLDLNAVVTAVEPLLRRLIGEPIRLVTCLQPDLGRVRADPTQVEQVILNLAVNARDAMPDGGALTLETADIVLDDTFVQHHPGAGAGPHVVLRVGDSGIGMSRETQARIFEPFFTTKAPGKGTGLGLATVYGIAKQSDGYIAVESEVGRGTTFRLYLPEVEEPLPAGPAATILVEPGRAAATVLLVEDEEELRELTREILEANGYRVLDARTPDEGLAIGAQEAGPIHLLLTDVVMPGINGRELADRLAAARPDLRVLYMSGYTGDTIGRHGVLEPGIALLGKPFTPEELVGKVREVLDGRRAR